MPKGASNKWHNDSLKADIAEILLTLDKGDCFTRFTLARMLYALGKPHKRIRGTKRLAKNRNERDISAYLHAATHFTRLANIVASKSDEINFKKRYMRAGVIPRTDVLGDEIQSPTDYYEVQ